MSSEGKRWVIYLDKRVGESWWRVRWGDTPREGAEGYEVVEVAPASEAERLREALEAIARLEPDVMTHGMDWGDRMLKEVQVLARATIAAQPVPDSGENDG